MSLQLKVSWHDLGTLELKEKTIFFIPRYKISKDKIVFSKNEDLITILNGDFGDFTASFIIDICEVFRVDFAKSDLSKNISDEIILDKYIKFKDDIKYKILLEYDNYEYYGGDICFTIPNSLLEDSKSIIISIIKEFIITLFRIKQEEYSRTKAERKADKLKKEEQERILLSQLLKKYPKIFPGE